MALFEDWLARNTRYEAMQKAQVQRLPLTAVNPPSAVLQDPHLQARGFFVDVTHPVAGTLPHTREPFRMAATPTEPGLYVRRLCWGSILRKSCASVSA